MLHQFLRFATNTLRALLARESRRMSLADCTLRPFTALERVFPAPPRDCAGLAA